MFVDNNNEMQIIVAMDAVLAGVVCEKVCFGWNSAKNKNCCASLRIFCLPVFSVRGHIVQI